MPNWIALSEDQRDRLLSRRKNVELAIDSISDEQPSSDIRLSSRSTERSPERQNGNINVVEADGTYDSAALRKPRVQETTPCQRPRKRRFAFGGRSQHYMTERHPNRHGRQNGQTLQPSTSRDAEMSGIA